MKRVLSFLIAFILLQFSAVGSAFAHGNVTHSFNAYGLSSNSATKITNSTIDYNRILFSISSSKLDSSTILKSKSDYKILGVSASCSNCVNCANCAKDKCVNCVSGCVNCMDCVHSHTTVNIRLSISQDFNSYSFIKISYIDLYSINIPSASQQIFRPPISA
ncbi:MAG: hypothetical protein RLZZ210_163 [Pseudomonadota bacterium]|jgi:hypothetical protein